ncbi:MAG TPA: LPS assembly protein LptD [Candidatus Dormibacteraeota bacterium]|nr:LPS assembly protein LptD [Candidatus Dormibacteraeota bacterium]
MPFFALCHHFQVRVWPRVRQAGIAILALAAFAAPALLAQQIQVPEPRGGVAELSASGAQKRQGNLFIADDDVDIRYGNIRLRADHVEYNEKSFEATARGHVQFDYDTQHLEGDEAHVNVRTGHGTFRNVRGSIKIERRANPVLLVTDNPLYFEAGEVERISPRIYVVRRAWITICDFHHPTWQFYAPHARIEVDKKVALINANFRVLRVPLVWFPYATAPAGAKIRQSGLLIPSIGNTTRKGLVLGEAVYWAPKQWMDLTLGGEYFSSRGTAQRADFRARPLENTSISYSYFGVIDRGIEGPRGTIVKQGGHQQQLEVQSLFGKGWRFVADVNQLSSLTFRLAFADTFGDAINTEVRSATFLTNNFRGFSFNVASWSDRSFLQISPQVSVLLRSSPEARFSSVEQSPWRSLPIYFGFQSFIGAVHRDDNLLNTPNAVFRAEFAPRVTVPLHLGPWLGVTTTAAFRTTRYGDSLSSPRTLSGNAIVRNTGEFEVALRPPTLERFFDLAPRKYKHTIEPYATYRYVTGVNHFADFIRFDTNSTITDTNEIEYGVTQRFFVKYGDQNASEFLSWRVAQKHYFDPTFGGAIVPGTRNVFQALDSFTPFAFASGPRDWSPLISDFKITPGGRFDTEQILEYDHQLQKVTTIGTLVKVKPYSEFFVTAAHFRLQGDPILQPLANQVRALFGYGSLTRKGFNAAAGISYDITHYELQNQLVQVSYNGGCCGIALEYRRIALGQVRTENQFRASFIIANIGNFGNLRHQERIF